MTKQSSNIEEPLASFSTWPAERVAQYLRNHAGLGDYYELLLAQKVTGAVAPRLTDADLREMGIANIGDRKMFCKALQDLAKQERKQERERVLWQGQEVMFFSWWDGCWGTCCGCVPVDPSEYTLTGTHLVIRTQNPCRIGPIPCCCNLQYVVDNVDLTHVVDADVHGVPAPCCQHVFCCAKAQDHIFVKTRTEGTKTLKLLKGDGETIARKITNQVEEAQQMERD